VSDCIAPNSLQIQHFHPGERKRGSRPLPPPRNTLKSGASDDLKSSSLKITSQISATRFMETPTITVRLPRRTTLQPGQNSSRLPFEDSGGLSTKESRQAPIQVFPIESQVFTVLRVRQFSDILWRGGSCLLSCPDFLGALQSGHFSVFFHRASLLGGPPVSQLLAHAQSVADS
jgi:hypothetical protein